MRKEENITSPMIKNVSKKDSIKKDKKLGESLQFKLFENKNRDIVTSAVNKIILTRLLVNSLSPWLYAWEGFLVVE